MSNEILANKIEDDFHKKMSSHYETMTNIRDILRTKSDEHLYVTLYKPINFRQLNVYNTTRLIFKTAWVKDDQHIVVNTRKTWGKGSGFKIQDVVGFGNIKSFQLIPNMTKKYTFEDVKNRLYDETTWSSLKPEHFQHGDDPENYEFRNIKKCFSEDQLEEIRLAFKNKTKISVQNDGTKRDYSVHTRIENGEFKATFSSEYHLCGNGSYYLLLNPTTAVHYEDD